MAFEITLNLILQTILVISPSLLFYLYISKNIKKAILFNIIMVLSFFASIFVIANFFSQFGIVFFMVVFFTIFSISSFFTLKFMKVSVDLKRSLITGGFLTILVALFIVVGLGGFGLNV